MMMKSALPTLQYLNQSLGKHPFVFVLPGLSWVFLKNLIEMLECYPCLISPQGPHIVKKPSIHTQYPAALAPYFFINCRVAAPNPRAS